MSLDTKTLEGQMREILAQEYERETGNKTAEFIRLTKYRGVVSVDLAVAAMCRAVSSPAPQAGQVTEEQKELLEACIKLRTEWSGPITGRNKEAAASRESAWRYFLAALAVAEES